MLRISARAVVSQVSSCRPSSALLLKQQVANRSTLTATAEHDREYHLSADELFMKLYKQYGEMVKITDKIGSPDIVYIYNPNVIEQNCDPEGHISRSWGNSSHLRVLFLICVFIIHISSQGEEWQKFRTKVNPALMQPRNAKLYVSKIDEVAVDFIRRQCSSLDEIFLFSFTLNMLVTEVGLAGGVVYYPVEEGVRKDSEHGTEMYSKTYKACYYQASYIKEVPVEVPDLSKIPDLCYTTSSYWNKAVGLVALDKRLGCFQDNLQPDSEQQRMIHAVVDVIQCMYKLDMEMSFWKYFNTPTWNKFVKSMDCFTEVAMKYVKEAMERVKSRTPDEYDNLSILERLLLNEQDPKVAFVTSLDLLFGGIDTTALFFMQGILGKDEKHFPEPEKFIPERWMKGPKGEPAEARKAHPFIYMPFGFGPRMCLGKRFAEYEIFILITRVRILYYLFVIYLFIYVLNIRIQKRYFTLRHIRVIVKENIPNHYNIILQ
ncbi:hypothetical protein C0J52_18944 [Blattella germanica]|nr:hypothetical protein C0J52_18944 [Blattella germanica]